MALQRGRPAGVEGATSLVGAVRRTDPTGKLLMARSLRQSAGVMIRGRWVPRERLQVALAALH